MVPTHDLVVMGHLRTGWVTSWGMAAESNAVTVTAARLSQSPPPLCSLPEILLLGLRRVGVAEAELRLRCRAAGAAQRQKQQRMVMELILHAATWTGQTFAPKF